MVKQFQITFLFFAFVLCFGPARADDGDVVKSTIPVNYPPYYSLDENGNPEGFAIDVMNAIAERSGIKVQYTIEESWPKIIQALRDGKTDILPNIGITEERQKIANFTSPVETLSVSIFVRKDEKALSETYSLASKKVGVVTNNVGQTALRNAENISLVVYDDAVNALFGLLSGNIDAFVYPEPVAWNLARQAKVDDQIKTIGVPLVEIKRAIAVGKHRPELHNKLNIAIDEFVGTLEYQAIFIKWFGQPTPFWTTEKLAYTLVFVTFAALLVILSATYLLRINRNLNSEIQLRLKLEEELQSHLAIYETAINTPTLGFWVVDMRGNLLQVNQSYADMSGYSREELLSMSIPDIEALENPEETAAHIAEIVENKHGKFRTAHRKKDGVVFPVEITTTFTTDRGGLFLAFVEDITDRVRYEQGLEDKLAERTKHLNAEIITRKKGEIELLKLSRAVEQSAHIIFITDVDGTIEYVNPKFTELLGYDEAEVIGKNPRLFKSEDTPQKVHEELWETILSGHEWRGEIKDRRKDGSVFWASAAISPVRDDNDQIINFISVHEDITGRKEAELAMSEARRAAEVANKAKTDLLANMSHELRTPLNAIIGFSEAMLHQVLGKIENKSYLDYAKHIHDSGDHLLRLINDILDVSAIEAGKLKLHEEETSVKDVCDSSIQIIAPRAEEKSLVLKSIQHNSLPHLRCDELRLKQILINLLSNAVKFTPEGGEITCDARVDKEGKLVITVADTGIGMDENGLSKAVEQFGQVDSSLSRTHEGTGLGLPLTKGLVELHDGTMTISSDLGTGTKVSIQFPSSRVLTLD